jgi:hypothetical protein
MPEISLEAISTAGVLAAFLFAAAAGVTSRRGMQWIVVGVLFSCLPFVGEMGSRWIAGQRGGYERNDVRQVRADRGPEVDRRCVGRTSRSTVASGGSRGAASDDARCR